MAAGYKADSSLMEKVELAVKQAEDMGLGKSQEERLEMTNEAFKYADVEKNKRKEQKSENKSFRKCPTCGEKGKHRCTGCYLELYCSEACQKQDWRKGHNVNCKVTKAQFKEVNLTFHGFVGEEKQFGCGKEASQKNFVVKIGAIMEDPYGMSVRNKVDKFLGNLERSPGQEEVFDKVRKEVMEKGVKKEGAHVDWTTSFFGCYYALYKGPSGKGGHKLEINPDKMQPFELW